MSRKVCIVLILLVIVLLNACGTFQGHIVIPPASLLANKVNVDKQLAKATPQIIIARQMTTPTPKPGQTLKPKQTAKSLPTPKTTTVVVTPVTNPVSTVTPPQTIPTATVPGGGLGNSPYGPPPAITSAEVQLTQQLFGVINSDRATRGLYPFVWNATLSAGARQHAWDMVHCGFSHTCPSGLDQCVRIENEGFAGVSDCGECIGLAGPYPTAWGGVYNVQESMINEPPTGWHRIHLTSTTLHRIGVGLFVDSRGWVWFVEDMVS